MANAVTIARPCIASAPTDSRSGVHHDTAYCFSKTHLNSVIHITIDSLHLRA